MMTNKKKVLYITNVNIDEKYLPGVIIKIKGQVAAFRNTDFDIDLLYAGNNGNLFLLGNDKQKCVFRGSRQVHNKNIFSKLFSHLKIAWFGSINFRNCYSAIVKNGYDAIYIRFYVPGSGLIKFLTKFRGQSPATRILLEYPTLNAVTEFKKRDLATRITYYLNSKRITKLNQLSDYIVTLTKDKLLFGKPTIFMANGIELAGIQPVTAPLFNDRIVLLGVASDCAFYHGFDKVIKGLSVYSKGNKEIKVLFRLITNPLSRHVDELKNLAKELGVEELVSFELPKSREELKEEYNNVHIGMGTLAMHRINMMDNYSLKHREYAAFGLPFIMSKGDDYFENSPFVLVVERDEAPLDLQRVVDFYILLKKNYPGYPHTFRNSMENKITWNAQMKNVFEVIKIN